MGIFDRLFSRMTAHAERINNYFRNAVMVYALVGEEAARVAALAAAKVTAKGQRKSQVKYLEGMASDALREKVSDEIAARLKRLAADITVKDWTLADVMEQKHRLGQLDQNYLKALEKADPHVFTRRHPSLFGVPDTRKPPEELRLDNSVERLGELAGELGRLGPILEASATGEIGKITLEQLNELRNHLVRARVLSNEAMRLIRRITEDISSVWMAYENCSNQAGLRRLREIRGIVDQYSPLVRQVHEDFAPNGRVDVALAFMIMAFGAKKQQDK